MAKNTFTVEDIKNIVKEAVRAELNENWTGLDNEESRVPSHDPEVLKLQTQAAMFADRAVGQIKEGQWSSAVASLKAAAGLIIQIRRKDSLVPR